MRFEHSALIEAPADRVFLLLGNGDFTFGPGDDADGDDDGDGDNGNDGNNGGNNVGGDDDGGKQWFIVP